MKAHFLSVTTFLLCIAGISQASARDGYRIQLKFLGERDSVVYLAHYFGKALPTIYKMDSARVDKKGMAVLDKKDKITGGIYIILPSSRKSYFEFILDNGDDISITADMSKGAEGLEFKNSATNTDFVAYQTFLKKYGVKQEGYKADLAKAATKADTTAIREKSKKDNEDIDAYRVDYMKRHPNNYITHLFSAMKPVDVPEGPHYLPNGKVDSNFAWHYYRAHYWDGFAFSDDRLTYAPLLDNKLNEYFNKVVPQQADSVIVEADSILAKAHGSENIFKYTLNWISTNAQTTKVMGMDKVFVHLVENYYQKGEATWLSPEELEKYTDRANKIAPNIIGNKAPQLKMVGIDGREKALLDVDAKYTLLVFWSPDCGHCIHEMPILDSAYHASLKARGVRVYAVSTDANEETKWREFITKNHLEEWTHVYDPKRNSRYYALYDVNSTPSMYLIDEQKNIVGKKLDHASVGKVIDMLERRAAAANAQ